MNRRREGPVPPYAGCDIGRGQDRWHKATQGTTRIWILKNITLRVGGSKLYESTGISIATGFLIGVIISCVFGGILLLIRFFVPF